RLKPHKIPMTLLVAPELGHQFPPEWQKKAELEYVKYAGPNKGRSDYPERVRFVTHTLKYASCDWVEILGLDKHYERSLVDASKTEPGFTVKTANIRSLRLGLPAGFTQTQVVTIDDQKVNARPYQTQAAALNVYLEKRGGKWKSVLPQKLHTDRLRRVQKFTGLQGPIDDAFTDSFLLVRGSSKPWNDAAWKFINDNLKRCREEWARYYRGEL